MAPFSLRKRTAHDGARHAAAKPPPRWPVDPELQRRAAETRRRIEHTRRQIARHVLPDRARRSDHA
jgi:hypothetical protein